MDDNQLILHRLNQLDHKVDRIEESLNGNGEPGFKTRVDRLEQSKKTGDRHFFLVYSLGIAAVVKGVFDKLGW